MIAFPFIIKLLLALYRLTHRIISFKKHLQWLSFATERLAYLKVVGMRLYMKNSVGLTSTTNPKPKGQPSHCLIRQT